MGQGRGKVGNWMRVSTNLSDIGAETFPNRIQGEANEKRAVLFSRDNIHPETIQFK